ncbi:MAG: phosphoribosyltransferase [Acidimicrobiia bacterium]
MIFRDRYEAGALLGEELAHLQPVDPLVLALPRGGVPVGYEVARALGCDLDVLVIRKVGVPGQPELAMGAVGEGGVVVRNEEVIRLAGVNEETFTRVAERERAELERRLADYRAVAEPKDPAGRTAVVVDDGLATGSTAMAAVGVLRRRKAREVWVAVPVAPQDTTARLTEMVERVVVLHQPKRFFAVGAWYSDFSQTSDDEVRRLLAELR